MLQVCIPCSKAGKIIQEHLHESKDIFLKYFHNNHLESSWDCLQSEHHDDYNENTPFREEHSLLFIFFGHPNLTTPVESVHEAIYFMPNHHVKHAIHKR